MAITEKYANFNLGTGSNDGTTEANAWQTPGDIVEAAGERVNVKDGARYAVTVTWASTAAGSATQPVLIRGYTTTIGDGGKCKLSGSVDYIINITGKYTYFENFDITSTATQFNHTSNFASNQGYIKNCKLVRTTTGSTNHPVISISGSSIINCYIEGYGSNSSTWEVLTVSGSVTNTVVVSTNGQKGLVLTGSFAAPMASNVLVYSKVSTTLAGISYTGLTNSNGFSLNGFTVDGFDDGLLFLLLPAARPYAGIVSNGIISGASNAILTSEATIVTGVAMTDIAFYNNTNDYSDMGDNEVQDPIALSADPYVDSANGDFRPNTTSGGGADLRGVAGMGAGEVTNNQDIGALQHADPAGGAGGICKLVGSGGLVG